MSHAAFAPPPPSRLPLRVELFVLAHNDIGEPLVHLPSLSLGLSGAILTALNMPVERVRVVGDAVVVVDRRLSGDPVADWAITFLAGYRPALTVREALRHLAIHAYDKTTAGLIAGGLVERASRRRLLTRTTTYPLTDPTVTPRVRGRLRYVLQGEEDPDPQTDALAGMIRALGLESELYLDALGEDLRALLRQMLARTRSHFPATQTIITTVEELVGETAVSVYR